MENRRKNPVSGRFVRSRRIVGYITPRPKEKRRKRAMCGAETRELASGLIEQARQERAPFLDLSDLELTSLPRPLSKLGHLKKLILDGNCLRKIPRDVASLSHLQELSVVENELRELPEFLGSLKNLRRLRLFDNPDLNLPVEVLESASPKILDYYHRLRREQPRELREVKILFLGRGAVGKTSLIKRLRGERFNKSENTTHGIRIYPLQLPLLPQRKRNPIGKVTAHLWDFGGQEILHATHQFFLSRRSVYVVVLSGREGRTDEDAEYWMRLIASFGGESPVIIVRNKIDSEYFEVDEPALRAAHNQIFDFTATDAATGRGITDLHAKLIRAIGVAPGVRALFPQTWFRIKEALRKDIMLRAGNSWIPFEEFRELCLKYGEKDPNAQELLATWLHDLGIALNYREDQRLNDTSVLDPLWVTRGIYAILTATKLAKAGGVLKLRDVPFLLRERKIKTKDYPRELQAFLIALMRKFELCYELPNKQDGDLVPELLPAKQPPAVARFPKDGESTALRYRYHVLPEGLLPRFITRMHPFLEKGKLWRRGAILRHEKARALIIGNDFERTVTIRVHGDRTARYKLLAIIRSDFVAMHEQLKGVKPLEETEAGVATGLWVGVNELQTFDDKGTKQVPRAHDGSTLEVQVRAQLNALEPAAARRREKRVGQGILIAPPIGRVYRGPLKVFVSYSHADEKARKKDVTAILKVLENERLIKIWDDRMLMAGDDWDNEIREKVRTADLIIFLVTREFIISNYIQSVEAGLALERAAAGEARIVGIVLRRCGWEQQPWARYLMLPSMHENRRAVQDWRPQAHAWDEIESRLRDITRKMLSRRNRIH